MNKIFFLVILSFLTVGCTETVDFSNPKSVIERYYKLKGEGNLKLEFELVADTCKEFATLQDYLNQYNTRNSLVNIYDFSVQEIEQLPINALAPKYRLFEISYMTITKSTKDTLKYISYETVYNEKGKWKIIWTENLAEAADKLINEEKDEDGMRVYREILKYDPLNGNAYLGMGWSEYRRDNYESAIVYAKKAIELNPKNEANYNLLAGIFSSQNNNELAAENYKRAIDMTLNERQKVYILSNLSTTYMDLLEYDDAKKVLRNALSIDSNYTHAWWRIGFLNEKENHLDSAIICYKKAIQYKPMENFLQNQLYFSLSNAEFIKATTIESNNANKEVLLTDAKRQIVKALDLQPENQEYRKLLYQINKKLNTSNN